MENVFDHFYKDYDRWYDTNIGKFVDKVEYDAFISLLKPRLGQTILDVGCGTGNQCIKLAGIGCNMTGVDIAPNMIKQGIEKSKKLGLNIDFKIMDCQNLEFPDNHFDSVISMAAFESVQNINRAYKEMKRVVKPGGTIVIGTIQGGGAWA